MTDKERIAALEAKVSSIQKKLDQQTLMFIKTNEESKRVLLRAESDLKSQAEQIAVMREALEKVLSEMDSDVEGGSCGHEGLRETLALLSFPSPAHDAKERAALSLLKELIESGPYGDGEGGCSFCRFTENDSEDLDHTIAHEDK